MKRDGCCDLKASVVILGSGFMFGPFINLYKTYLLIKHIINIFMIATPVIVHMILKSYIHAYE